MNFPSHFYYSEKSSETQYGTIVRGTPSVERLIKGMPCWPKPIANNAPKPKSLILSDWTYGNWPREKTESVISQFGKMMDEGFKIYYWDNGILSPLTKESLSCLSKAQSQIPLPDALRDTVTRQCPELTPSNSHIIDDYELNALLSKNKEVVCDRSIDLSDLVFYTGGNTHIASEFLKSYLKAAIPPLKEILITEYSSASDDLEVFISKSFPQILLEVDLSALALEKKHSLPNKRLMEYFTQIKTQDADQFDKLLELCGQLSQLKKITFKPTETEVVGLGLGLGDFITEPNDSKKLKDFNLPMLEHLVLEGKFSIGQLGQFINQAKKLRYLDIKPKKNYVKPFEITPHQLLNHTPLLKILILGGITLKDSNQPYVRPNLEYLTINGVNGFSNMLSQLVGDGASLKGLSIHNCEKTDNKPLKIEDLTLTNLEEFSSIYEDALSLPAIKKIFSCPKIKIFTSVRGEQKAFSQLQPKDIPDTLALSQLKLDATPIPAETMLAILAKGHLRNLKLTNYPHILTIDFTKLPPLSSLEVLSLEDRQLTNEQLESLLNKTAKLSTLEIIDEKSRIDEIRGGDLSQLRTLKAFCPLLSESLFKVLLRTPKLIKLNLSQCTLDVYGDSWTINLPNIQEIAIRNTKMAQPYLNMLIANSKALEALDLQGATILPMRSFNKQLIKLTALKYLNLSKSNIPEAYFLYLLDNAPNLQEVNLSSIKNIASWSEKTRQRIANLNTTSNIHILNYDVLIKELFPTEPAVKPGARLIPEDPIHDPQKYFQPKEEPLPFKFKGENKLLNQQMIIEKLSQYLTLTKQHTALIPKLQDGICRGLAYYFKTMTIDNWKVFVDRIAAWDGQEVNLTQQLKQGFDSLWQSVHAHQFDQPAANCHYLGDNLKAFLATKPAFALLRSPWHAAALSYDEKKACWYLYDPNYPAGYKTIDKIDDLQGLIQKSLGQVVFVEGASHVPPLIKDADKFLHDGGLIALLQTNNPQELLKQLIKRDYSKEALEGLFIRTTSGETVWQKTLADPLLSTFTLTLMEQYEKKQANFKQKLEESMQGLTPQQEHEAQVDLAKMHKLVPTKAPLIEQLRQAVGPKINHDYRRLLETWRKPLATAPTARLYCQQLIAKNDYKKKLIVVKSNKDAEALSLQVLRHCLSVSRPIYCINSPDDLVCSANWVERTANNKGIIHKGPGGPFHEFLNKHQGQSPIVLVNYANFKTDDIIRLNSLLDKQRIADGTPLPEDALVLGITNPNEADAYHGADFYSRFDAVETSALSAEALQKDTPSAPPLHDATTPIKDVYFINLAHSPQWEERLLGRWLIKKDQLIFEEGELTKALASKKPICIQNGLWDNPRFQIFWQQAQVRGYIAHAGQVIKIPPTQVFTRSEGYDWAALKTRVRFSDALPAAVKPILLNPKSLSDLFSTYEYDKKKETLNTQPGLLEQHQGKTMHLTITSSLSKDEWGSLLEACKVHQVQLVCQRMPGVIIPKAIADMPPLPKLPTIPWNAQHVGHPTLIISTDSAVTVALMTQDKQDWETIEISEADAGALLGTLNGRLENDRFRFNQSLGAVHKALEGDKKVLLHGQFSQELMDALAPLLLNPLTKGRLVLVSEQATAFQAYSCAHHAVSLKQSHDLLKATDEELKNLPEKNAPFNRLRAQLHYQRAFPAKSNKNPWQGMTEALPLQLPAFDAQNTKKVADEFMQGRFNDLQALLKHAPFVCLTGPSGIGKSAFVEDYLNKQSGYKVFKGESRITAWIDDKSPGQKILFIDEANITSRQWSEFEGLFNTPPGILINGIYQVLSPSHKVIFAFNPLNYGGERQQPLLFARHGNALAFNPLPLELIDEYMLKPVLAGTSLAEHQQDLMKPLLDVYSFIVRQTQEEVLISPREVQMMALLLLSYAKKHPEAKVEDLRLAAQHYAYRLGRDLNKNSHRDAFEQQFKPKKELPHEFMPHSVNGFRITASRKVIAQQIDDLLSLRALRQEASSNKTQQYGGLGGAVLQGPPGCGKSELVLSSLLARGYRESRDYYGPPLNPPQTNIFYRLPVSMATEEKRHLLLKAFHEGAVVVIDEINSSPMMERLLNDLLMGKTPENESPKHPGFLIIGTQNPPEMGGRIRASTAMARRLISTSLPDYTAEELHEILLSKGLSSDECNMLVEAFLFNCNKAACEHLKPAPTFRDLMRTMESGKLQKAKKEKLMGARQAVINEPIIGKAITKDDISEQEKETARNSFEYAQLLIEVERNYVTALPHLKRAVEKKINGAQKVLEQAEMVVKRMTPDARALMQKNINKEDAILCFFEQHRQVFTKSRNEFFGSWRRTEVKIYWELEKIISHGMKSNNRTRGVCVELGWLTPEGKLNKNAPQVIHEAVAHLNPGLENGRKGP